MRIPSGSVDRVINFVGVDATDLKTRETGLASFTVYHSRNGGAAAVMTTPTVAELSLANMPGVYTLLVDEDTTIGATHDTEEMVFHITHAGMAPVTRVVELYRPKGTEGQTATINASGQIPSSNAYTGTPPSAAQNATALLTDLLSSSDFNTVGSFGKLVKDNLNATVDSRMATFVYTVPPTAAAIATQTDTTLSASHGSGTWGGTGTVVLTHVVSTVSAGEVVSDDLLVYQHETKPFVFRITDEDGIAIDETGDTMKLVVQPFSGAAAFEVAGTVGGASGNHVTVTIQDENTTAAGFYRYALWNVTEDVVRARGKLEIVPCPQPA